VNNIPVSTFQLFATYVNCGRILPLTAEDRARFGESLDTSKHVRLVEGEARENDLEDVNLVRLHHFAQTCRCASLASDSISLLLAQNANWKSSPPKAAIEYVLAHFDDYSPMHKLFADEVAFWLTSTDITAQVFEYPQSFVMQIIKATLVERDSSSNKAQTMESRWELSLRGYIHHEANADEDYVPELKSFSVGIKHSYGHELYSTTVTAHIGPEALPKRCHSSCTRM
jgi:hypothetical protein